MLYFPCENDLCRAVLPDCLETLSSTLCQISALKEAIGSYVYEINIFLKWGILNVPFCSILIFVPFHFYLVMTLVVPCLDNVFMVLLISELAKIGGPPRGDRVCLFVGMVCYHYIVHILNSRKKHYFLRL